MSWYETYYSNNIDISKIDQYKICFEIEKEDDENNLEKEYLKSLEKIEFIHQKHDGSWSGQVDREIFGGAHVSTLIPYDPERKEIVLIQQFRAGAITRYDEDYLFEIVAGIIDENESPEETAKRECFEETGCIVNKIIPIQGYFPAPGSSESYYHLFLGEIDAFDGERIKGLENENENILTF